MLESSMIWPFQIFIPSQSTTKSCWTHTLKKLWLKKSRIIAWEHKLGWEHLFQTYPNWNRRKNGLVELQNSKIKNWAEQQNKQITPHGFQHKNEKKNLTLPLVPNYLMYPYKCPYFHLWKILPYFWAKEHFPVSNANTCHLHTN